jgi:phosphate transport system substrate-binding protein
MQARPIERLSRRRFLTTVTASVVAFTAAQIAPSAAAETLRFGGTGAAVAGVQLLAEAFRRRHPDVNFELVTGLGSSGGIKGVGRGVIDFAIAGRPLKPDEAASGVTSQPYAVTPFVFVSAPDAIAERKLTTAQVADIYAGKMLSWPNGLPIRPVLRPPSDFEAVVLRQLSPQMQEAVDAALSRPGMTVSPTGQDHGDFLENLPGSFGAIAFGQVVAEKRKVDVLALDAVFPSPQALADGSYPHRLTFHMVSKPQASLTVKTFFAFIRTPEGAEVLKTSGCLPSPSPAR